MTTATAEIIPSPQPKSATLTHRPDAVAEIISRARTARQPMSRALLPAITSGFLLWLAFTPVDCGPLAWIALVPLLQLVRIKSPTSRMTLAVWFSGATYWLITLQWMRLGDPTMYIAWLGLTVYLACYWPVFVGLTRVAVHRRRIPLLVAAPTVWVGLEYFRSHLFTGFAWYLLGHSQYRWVEMIQISDLAGGYAVSFLIVMANACLAEFIPEKWLTWFGLIKPSDEGQLAEPGSIRRRMAVAVMLTLLIASLGYGYTRRSQAAFTTGPRVALIEGNFPAYVRSNMTAEEVMEEWAQIYRTHRYLTGLAIPEQPDLVVWPEVMFRYPLMFSDPQLTDEELGTGHPDIPPEQWRSRTTRESLEEMARESGAGMIIGVDAYELTREHGYRNFNSAVYLDPDLGLKGRYDKIHRVIFGEYIPLRESLPFLQRLTPYSGDFGIAAGNTVRVFQYKDWRFLPNICYEDTVPHLIRNMISTAEKNGPPVDCIVNLSNDGWFHGSSELDQHLITAQFRCVETRTPMIRAVNTGISAIIDGDGVVREPEVFRDLDSRLSGEPQRESIRDPKTGRYHRQLNCALIGDVPLDPRSSLYVRYGDWLAMLCLLGSILTALQSLIPLGTRPITHTQLP